MLRTITLRKDSRRCRKIGTVIRLSFMCRAEVEVGHSCGAFDLLKSNNSLRSITDNRCRDSCLSARHSVRSEPEASLQALHYLHSSLQARRLDPVMPLNPRRGEKSTPLPSARCERQSIKSAGLDIIYRDCRTRLRCAPLVFASPTI